MTNRYGFEGRNAIVTGGADGIGYAIAQRLVEGGAKVCIWDRNPDMIAKARQALPALAAQQLDVSSEPEVQRAFSQAVETMGKVDVLVCSAGITGPNLQVKDYSLKDWQQVLDINLTGVFLCNRAVAAHMQANAYGRIVNIASIAGKEGNPNASAYSASKAGVIALTKSLGKELAKDGVAVNCITPAAVRTSMFSQMTQQHIDYMLSKIPMGRFGLAEEIAAMVTWLASEECSFSTGAVFDLSGGRATY